MALVIIPGDTDAHFKIYFISFLPAPTQPTYSLQDEYSLFKSAPAPVQQQPQKPKKIIPPYGQRQGFVPRSIEDFGDGGAFPEIHVAQYDPLLFNLVKTTINMPSGILWIWEERRYFFE